VLTQKFRDELRRDVVGPSAAYVHHDRIIAVLDDAEKWEEIARELAVRAEEALRDDNTEVPVWRTATRAAFRATLAKFRAMEAAPLAALKGTP